MWGRPKLRNENYHRLETMDICYDSISERVSKECRRKIKPPLEYLETPRQQKRRWIRSFCNM